MNMGNKIMAVGFGLSPLGLGFFMPVLLPAAAIIMVVGMLAVVLDK